jgi:hypothetical protein
MVNMMPRLGPMRIRTATIHCSVLQTADKSQLPIVSNFKN